MEDRGLGVPKTEEERAGRHESLYGTEEVPPRGTGLAREELILKAAVSLDAALRRYLRYEEEIELTGTAGDNTKEWPRVGTGRILVITHMSAYDVDNACTYIRLGFWNRTRHIWPRIVPAPLVLETVEFNGELVLQEGMWPAVQWNGVTGDDDLHALVEGYWVRAPRIS